ncbi:MAG: 30S ribosomal protein S6 [Acidobacteria bacterium]|nr:30S ribosomal protein S6 [Acidobacteriota bacterium]
MSLRKYEVVFVLTPTLTEDEVDQAVQSFKKSAEEKGARILNVDQWGKRRLAFPVKKHNEGIYVTMTLEAGSGDAVLELERRFKVTDNVIRFLSVRTDLDLKRADKFKARREVRKKKRAISPPRRQEPISEEMEIEKE